MTDTSSPCDDFRARFVRALLFLVLCAAPLAAQSPNLDVRLFRSINSTQNPERNGFFEYLDLSSLPSFAAFPAGFILVGALADDHWSAQTGLMLAGGQLTTLGVTSLLKGVFDRPRPFEVLDGVFVKHQWSALGSSFPSGHTSQAFTIATILSLRFSRPTVTIPMFLWAGAVGYARVYLGVHYPSDVLGGMVLGVAGGLFAWGLRHEFGRLSDRIASPEVMAQPSLGSLTLGVVRVQL